MKRLRKYYIIARTSVQSNLAYSANFLFDLLFYAFIIFVFLQLWGVIYKDGNTIAGYSYTQMIWYVIMTEMITLSGKGVFHEMNDDIKGGNIAYLLNKPYHYIFYQFSNSMGLTLIKLFINATAALIIGCLYVGPLPYFQAAHLPLIVVTIFMGIFLNFFMLMSLGLTAFWFEENTAFFWIYQKLVFMLGMFLPIEFFPKWLQAITLKLPFSYITYGPAKLVVDFSQDAFYSILGTQVIYLSFFLLLTLAIYRKGVRILNVNGG